MSSTRTAWSYSRRDLDALTWHMMPRDQGQIVEVSYALDVDAGLILQCWHDRSDGEIEYSAAKFGDGDFEPWNGDIGEHEPFLPVTLR